LSRIDSDVTPQSILRIARHSRARRKSVAWKFDDNAKIARGSDRFALLIDFPYSDVMDNPVR
jgi:hypothetical protein